LPVGIDHFQNAVEIVAQVARGQSQIWPRTRDRETIEKSIIGIGERIVLDFGLELRDSTSAKFIRPTIGPKVRRACNSPSQVL
jgi:hypothetical protein